jgi:hypothetical protein
MSFGVHDLSSTAAAGSIDGWPAGELVSDCVERLRRRDREQVSFGEHLLGDEGGIERFGHAAVDGGVQERFDDLVGSQTDVERGVDVYVELGFAAAQGGEHAEGDELAVTGVRPSRAYMSPNAQATTWCPSSGEMSASAAITFWPPSPSMVVSIVMPRSKRACLVSVVPVVLIGCFLRAAW